MSNQEPSVREKIIKKAESLAQRKKEIEAGDLPLEVKKQKVEVINSEIEWLAKTYNRLLRS